MGLGTFKYIKYYFSLYFLNVGQDNHKCTHNIFECEKYEKGKCMVVVVHKNTLIYMFRHHSNPKAYSNKFAWFHLCILITNNTLFIFNQCGIQHLLGYSQYNILGDQLA
jgi:hypothetical protein